MLVVSTLSGLFGREFGISFFLTDPQGRLVPIGRVPDNVFVEITLEMKLIHGHAFQLGFLFLSFIYTDLIIKPQNQAPDR